MFGNILILFAISLALLSLVGMIKPGIVMQADRQKVLLHFFVPAVALFLIGRSLVE